VVGTHFNQAIIGRIGVFMGIGISGWALRRLAECDGCRDRFTLIKLPRSAFHENVRRAWKLVLLN
jgi:hypothetical protein